jgi:hypothetical protein
LVIVIKLGIPDIRNEKAGQSSQSIKSYHRAGGLAEVCLLILLATIGRNTPELTTKMGKYM